MQGKNNKNKKNNKYLALYISNPVIYGVMRNENKNKEQKMENYCLQLESVGCVINKAGYVYAVNEDGSTDYFSAVHFNDCSQEWIKSLSVADCAALDCFNFSNY